MYAISEQNLQLARRIAGEIVISDNPGLIFKKWRETFHISQIVLAEHLKISPSVISDYESGRRKSPGQEIIKRFICALLNIDELKGSPISAPLRRLQEIEIPMDIFIDLYDYLEPISIDELCHAVQCNILNIHLSSQILGYVVINTEIMMKQPFSVIQRIFNASNLRALIFTNIFSGKSVMLSLKNNSNISSAIIFHKNRSFKIDKSSLNLDFPILETNLPIDVLLQRLRRLNVKIQ